MRSLTRALALLLALTGAAFARSPSLHNYFLTFHFTKQAWGRPVAAVYVHCGALTENPVSLGGDAFWTDVKHLPMTDKGDYFFAKTRIQSWSHPGGPQTKGPLVQYWVHFADGTRTITREVPVRVEGRIYDSWGKNYADAVSSESHEFDRLDTASETSGVEIRVVPRD